MTSITYLFEVEDNVKFANRTKVFVEEFDVAMDYLKREKLIVRVFYGAAKV